jgi:hypothetical protein
MKMQLRRLAIGTDSKCRDRLWLVIRGYKDKVLDRATAEGIVDDLINTGMWLPVADGAALFAWAYGEGLLP